MGIDYQARRYETLQTGLTLADLYEEAAAWCELDGSNLDMFTALDVVGFPVWDGLQHCKILEDIMWLCGSKYLMSKQERATLLCFAAAIERQGW